jgi:hypothetical protein
MLGEIQVPAQLQIHPKRGYIAEIFGEIKCGLGGDPTPSVDQIVDALVWNMNHIQVEIYP